MNAREKLQFHQDPYDHKGTSQLFIQAMVEVLQHHQLCNPFFAALLEKNQLNPSDLKSEEDLEKIPPIPANFFKYYECLSIPREKIVEHVTSSGTSGQKSQMFFDRASWDFGLDMIKSLFNYFGFQSDQPANYILYTYEPTQESKLGTAKTDEGLLQYAPVNKKFFALRFNGAGHDFDVYGTINKLLEYEKEGLPVRIFGFPSFLHFTLRQMESLHIPPLKLNKSSMTMLGGGWKGHADKQVDKLELYALVEKMLGIPAGNCRDGYGSTEHSVPYFECRNHNFHIPIYSRVLIRNVKTLAPQPIGEKGFANFITPHLLSVPAISVLMGDLAVLHQTEECGCGIETPFMEILGRAGTSAAKSCAITASELLRKKEGTF